MQIGAGYQGNAQCEFVVWAPLLQQVELKIVAPVPKVISMSQDAAGYWRTRRNDIVPGTRYLYRLNQDKVRPDPASHSQPDGVHQPSAVVDHASFVWADATWHGMPVAEMVIYELHVGTFTSEGSFAAIMPRLADLKEIGINAIEIMPVAQFPGERNWGYDGVYPFAVQNSYGGPEGLKQLVNNCHCLGMAVILDVVYNHLGPEGNYLWDYGPYFTDRYHTPWGQAVNFDGPYSDGVRNFFVANAWHWFKNYHVDALRLDAIHAIVDTGACHFLEELAQTRSRFSQREGRQVYLIAESDLNDPKIIRPRAVGGYGVDAQWCDDFHHALHTLLTGEKHGYYLDFGTLEQMVQSLHNSFVYRGQHSPYRKRRHGAACRDREAGQFIVCSQNHDQVGNRMLGERLATLVNWESLKLAASMVIFSPCVPLLFMGEEYGERSPFLYFVSHGDQGLIEAVRAGRKKEFATFAWRGEPPDPQVPETFTMSKLQWQQRKIGQHQTLCHFYRQLLKLRRTIPALASLDKECLQAWQQETVILMHRWQGASHVLALFNFSNRDTRTKVTVPEGEWHKELDSAEPMWDGPGSLLPDTLHAAMEIGVGPHAVALYHRKEQ